MVSASYQIGSTKQSLDGKLKSGVQGRNLKLEPEGMNDESDSEEELLNLCTGETGFGAVSAVDGRASNQE